MSPASGMVSGSAPGSARASRAAVDASSTAKANDEASFATREGARAPQLVLTCGFAGGLNPELKPGEVIFEISKGVSPDYLQENGDNQPMGQPWY